MNFAEIQATWQSPHNRPTPAQLDHQKMKFIADLRRRQRGQRTFLCVVLIPLVYITVKVVLHLVAPDPALSAIDLNREWAIIPLFALPWIGWLIMLRLHLRHRARSLHSERSISASVAALLDENRTERMRYKFIAGLLAASALVLPVIVYQLRAVGKAGDEIMVPALVIYPAYVLLLLAWLAYYFRKKLNPRKQELETLLGSYRQLETAP